MRVVPLFGDGIHGRSAAVTRQRRLNCYFDLRKDGDKTRVAVYGTPGLTEAFTLSDVARGLLGTDTGLYAVCGNEFQSLDMTGSVIGSGTLDTASGYVAMDSSASQVVVVDGASGYVWDGSTLTQIDSSGGFPFGAHTVAFVGGFFVAEQPGTQQFWVSDVFDGATWDTLAFGSASLYSDTLVAVDALQGNLITFSARHLEFFQNVGASPNPFAGILSAAQEYGLAAIWSRAHVGNSICFVAANPQGGAQVCRLQGYQLTVISTPDLDWIINQMDDYTDAVGSAFMSEGHPIYQVTFPTADRTFIFDTLSGIWSDRQTGTTSALATRHVSNLSAVYSGTAYFSSSTDGKVYTQSPTVYTDDGETIVREIVTRHQTQDFNVFGVDEIYLDMQTGVGNDDITEPKVTIEVSHDGGNVWLTPREFSLGEEGRYETRVIGRQWGACRDLVVRVRMTDPAPFVITEGAMKIRYRDQ